MLVLSGLVYYLPGVLFQHKTLSTFITFQITRRYAEFSAAIVGVDQTFPSERVGRVLGQLQAEVENFVLKMAAQFPHRREQLIFLINNYDMMLGVLVVSIPVCF